MEVRSSSKCVLGSKIRWVRGTTALLEATRLSSILGFYWDYIGMMENETQTTI